MDKKIEEWVRADLLNREAADAILDYEARKPSGSWILSGFLILGAVTIGIGIISLIAANWDAIPDSVKLAADLALLCAIAYGAFKTHVEGKPLYFEMYLAAFQISCLASIGLISQIYNTGGKAWQALLLWSIISAGVAVASKKTFVPFIWATGFFSALFLSGLQSVWLSAIFEEQYPALVLAVTLLCALMAIACRKFSGESGQTHSLRAWSLLAVLISLITVEIVGINAYRDTVINFDAFLPGYIFSMLLGVLMMLDSQYNRLQTWISLLTLILFLTSFHFQYMGIKSEIVYAVSTLAILTFLALLMASLGGKKVFQILVILIGLRFLTLYFQALGGLATTGIGLIISGGLIIGMVTWWNKKRKAIADWAEGLLT